MKKLIIFLIFCTLPALTQTLSIDGKVVDPSVAHSIIYTPAPPVVVPLLLTPMHLGISTTSASNLAVPLPEIIRPCCGPVHWADIEGVRGKYNWSALDAWGVAAKNHNLQLMYTFEHIPTWAAKNNAAPSDVNSGDAIFKEFVTALMQHQCVAGKCAITVYESWNELNVNGFWTGNYHDLAIMSNDMATIVHNNCPTCIVLAGSTSAGGDGWNPAGGSSQFDTALAEYIGQWLKIPNATLPTGISYHAYGCRLSVTPCPMPTTIVSTSPLCLTTTPSAACRASIKDQPTLIRALFANTVLVKVPIWQTEGGWGTNDLMPLAQRPAYVSQWLIVQGSSNLAQSLWYAYDEPKWGTLTSTPSLVAWVQTLTWLTNSSLTSFLGSVPSGNDLIWSLNLVHNNIPSQIVWYTGSIKLTYNLPAKFKHVQTLQGIISSPSSISLGQEPVLLY